MIKNFLIIIFISFPFALFSGTSYFTVTDGSLGMIESKSSTAAMGRGGYELACFDSLTLNTSNYALWPFLTRTTTNLGFGYNSLSTETKNQSTSSTTGLFNGGHLAMPVIQGKLAIGVGLLPEFRNDQTISRTGISNDGNPVEIHKSTGNISNANFAISYALTKDFSVAAIASYNFGKISDEISVEYSTEDFRNVYIVNNFQIYGSSFSLHSFYRINDELSSGLRITFPAKLKLRTEQESRQEFQFVEEYKKITLPFRSAFGFNYVFKNLYNAGLDFEYQNWESGYKIDDISPINFSNHYKVSVGFEKMPTGRMFAHYLQKMYFRGGFYFEQMNIKSNNNHVNEYGISTGFGLPIISPYNRVDLAVQYGKRGSLSSNSATENIFRINLSITAGSLWFIQEDN